MPSIVIAMPAAQSNVKMHTTQTVVDTALGLRAAGHEARFVAAEFSEVVWARNFLASWALNNGADLLYFIDSDMYFPPEVSLALVAADKDVIGAVYPRRHVDMDKLVANARAMPTAKATEVLGRTVDYCVRVLDGALRFTDGIAEAAGVGMGAAVIKASVLRAMIDRQAAPLLPDDKGVGFPTYGFFDPLDDERGHPLSEDFSFCARWRSLGGKVHVMDAPRVGHIGTFNFRGSYADAMIARAPTPPTWTGGASISFKPR